MFNDIEIINLEKLGDYIMDYDKDILIVGSPISINLTEELIDYFSYIIFFESNFNIFYLTDSVLKKQEVFELFEKSFLNNFSFQPFVNKKLNFMRVENNFIGINSYENDEFMHLVGMKASKPPIFSITIVDEEFPSDILNYYLEEILPVETKKLCIITTDRDDSVFYFPIFKDDRVKIFSDLIYSNLQEFYSENNTLIKDQRYEKLITGNFNNNTQND
jgi:hypothetical protein